MSYASLFGREEHEGCIALFLFILNYVKSFAFKRIRPLDKSVMQRLFMIDKQSDKYIFQRHQFSSFPTQLYLFGKTIMFKLGIV